MKKQGIKARLDHSRRTSNKDRIKSPWFDSENKSQPHATCVFIASTGEAVRYTQTPAKGGQVLFIPELSGVSPQALKEWSRSMAKRNRQTAKKQRNIENRDGGRRFSKKQKEIEIRKARAALKAKREREDAAFGWNK